MKVARIYTGPDERSHFEDLEMPFTPAPNGLESPFIAAKGVVFRENPVNRTMPYHPAPRRQLVVTVSGVAEIECGDGTRRRFGPGDLMIADDTTGQGHISREIEGPRHIVFIHLPPDFDVTPWRREK